MSGESRQNKGDWGEKGQVRWRERGRGGKGEDERNNLWAVGLICTGALVSWQDICQELLGGGWRREQRVEDPAQALPPPQAPLGLAQVHGAFLISPHSGAPRHGAATSPGDAPYLAASSLSPFSCFSQRIPQPPSHRLSLLLPLQPTPPLPVLFPGAPPFPAGQAGRLGTGRFRVATTI